MPRVWRGLSPTRDRRRPRAASLQREAMQLHLDEIASRVTPGAHANLLLDQAGWQQDQNTENPEQHLENTCRSGPHVK